MKKSFFLAPEYLSLPFFGLCITQSSIKLTHLKRKSFGYIPSVIENIEINETCDFFTDHNSVEECEKLTQNLKDLKKKYNIQFVQLSIPEEDAYVFRTSIPTSTLDLVEEFIQNNIDQYIPFVAADVYFDYKILKSHSLETTPIVVTAIPRVIVQKYTNLLNSCGITTLGCEPETHAIARCVIDKGDLDPYLIINIGASSSSISVVEEGLVQYTQALTLKTPDVINGMSAEVANSFKDSINKVIIYWFTSKDHQAQNPKIENIILTGENIESSNLINFLESNLAVNVSYANVWKNCFDVHDYVPEISKEDSLKYAACIGLAMFKIK